MKQNSTNYCDNFRIMLCLMLIGSWEDARKRLRKSEETSDLQTDDELPSAKRQTK